MVGHKKVKNGGPVWAAPNEVSGRVSAACELTCTGPGGEVLPSPLSACARAVSPRPAVGVCRLTAANPQLV